jgi:hypothetical protein
VTGRTPAKEPNEVIRKTGSDHRSAPATESTAFGAFRHIRIGLPLFSRGPGYGAAV